MRLTLILPTWRIRWAPNNASKWQTGFNLAFKGVIIEKEKAYYWKPVRKKKVLSRRTSFEARFYCKKILCLPYKNESCHNVSGSSCTVSWGPIRISSIHFMSEISSCWTQVTCEDYHVAGHRRGKFLTRPLLARYGLWTVYFHLSNEEMSRCGLALATQQSAGRGSLGGLTATKHTEMTRSYVLKRVFAGEACRNVI